jgi:hypothetical protein
MKWTMKYITSPKIINSIEGMTPDHEWLAITAGGWGRSKKLRTAISLALRWQWTRGSKSLAVYRVTGEIEMNSMFGDVIHTCPGESDRCHEESGSRCTKAPILYMTRNADGLIRDNLLEVARRVVHFVAVANPDIL